MCDNGKTAADITVTSAVIRRCSSSMQLIDGGRAWRGISGKSFLPKYEFLRDRKPKYFEEYRDVLFRAPGVRPGKVITATGDWLSSQPVIAYHGSRLTPAEIENVILKGLAPLHARRRIDRLRLIFSQHPNWCDISSRLSEVIDEFGAHGLAKGHGLREGFVHAAISRDSLINCFDRYLTYGSEFDQMIALTLVGRSGLRLLASHGQAVLFRLRIPPAVVIKAANPCPGVGEKIPRPIGDILYSWARWVVDGACSNTNAGVDCGLRFDAQIPPNWIVGHEILDRSVVLNAIGSRKSPPNRVQMTGLSLLATAQKEPWDDANCWARAAGVGR